VKAPTLFFLSPRDASSNGGGQEDMLARTLWRRAALARRVIGAVALARRAVVEVTHFHRGKKPCRVPRVCRLVVSRLLFSRRSAERAVVQRAARRVAPALRGRWRVWVERSGGSHRRS